MYTLGQTLVKGEPCEPHDSPLGMPHVKQLILAGHVQHIIQHGRKILLSVLVKSRSIELATSNSLKEFYL